MNIEPRIVNKRIKCVACNHVVGEKTKIEDEFYTTSVCEKVVSDNYKCPSCGSNVFNVEIDLDVSVKK